MTAQTVELAYVDSGAGKPVVLLMGLGADSSAWEPHSEVWSRSFRCISVDNRGAGRSPSPTGPYSTQQMADDTAALIKRLALGAVAVVGISMGGAIAQELALRHPRLVSALVLTATWSKASPYTKAVFETLGIIRTAASPAEFTRHLQTVIWTPEWFDAHIDELVEDRGHELPVGARALRAQIGACVSHDAHIRIPNIGVPALVTVGGVDRFIPLSLGVQVATSLPGAHLEVFERSGHAHHWEELDRYNELVGEWLSR